MKRLLSNISTRIFILVIFYFILKILAFYIFPEAKNIVLLIFSGILAAFFELIGLISIKIPYDKD